MAQEEDEGRPAKDSRKKAQASRRREAEESDEDDSDSSSEGGDIDQLVSELPAVADRKKANSSKVHEKAKIVKKAKKGK